MRSRISADEVLNDIEFELIQSSVSRDDLGTGIQAVRQYQNSMRAEIMDRTKGHTPSVLDLAGRQFQFNDLTLTLFQESSARLQALQLELRRATFLKQHTRATNDRGEADTEEAEADAIASAIPVSWLGITATTDGETAQAARIEQAMSADALEVALDMRPVNIPLLGAFLTRLRSALHSLTLFYVNRLARRQLEVNQVLGEQLLRLMEVNQVQAAEIARLRTEVARLTTERQQALSET